MSKLIHVGLRRREQAKGSAMLRLNCRPTSWIAYSAKTVTVADVDNSHIADCGRVLTFQIMPFSYPIVELSAAALTLIPTRPVPSSPLNSIALLLFSNSLYCKIPNHHVNRLNSFRTLSRMLSLKLLNLFVRPTFILRFSN